MKDLEALPGWSWSPAEDLRSRPLPKCTYCNSDIEEKRDRRAVNLFCCREHYHAWRRETSVFEPEERHRDYARYKRLVWGGSGKGSREVGRWAREFGRSFEDLARDLILPQEGFSEIVDLSGMSNMFFIDFVATKGRKRVLLDVTSKWQAYIPDKHRLAVALRMPFYMLHVSPANPEVYYLHKPLGVTSRVPMAVFHRLHAQAEAPIVGWPRQIAL